MSEALESADVSVVNLETALTERTRPATKELEAPEYRYWFKAPPAALGVLARSGVDVASIANNHTADFGVGGLRDTLAAGRRSEVALIGAGLDQTQAFTPYRTTVRDTAIAVLAADASPLESDAAVWSVRQGSGPGIAGARGRSAQLVAAVEAAAVRDDVVVVYMHWGQEYASCPNPEQRSLAERLAAAGADVVVGTHSHTLQGAGQLGSTYVAYGLGNLLWYHAVPEETGVLRVRVSDGEVVGAEWLPGRVLPNGQAPQPLRAAAAEVARADWRALRDCTGLAPLEAPPAEMQREGDGYPLPEFSATVTAIGPAVRERMTSHDGDVCPVSLDDLRYLRVNFVGFDGEARTGELVVAADVADDVVEVFSRLYAERFPIHSMELVDEFGGDDDGSMAANNTSAYSCRTVAGSAEWSDHAFGRAVDINPAQNPYVVDGEARPPVSRPYADVDRSEGAEAAPGVITEGGVVHRAFAAIGWDWGGRFVEPDFQHFSDRTY